MKIIVDAMGGDNAPDVTVRGAALAAKEYGEDILLVGQPEAITAVLRAHGLENTEHLTIMPASDIVDMHDDPATVLRRKPDSSMAVAFKLLKAAECTAEMLLQFAFLASLYAEKNNGLKSPRVGLVNNGTEDTKGDPLRRETYALLKAAGDAGRLNFVGNVEGSQVPLGACDVAVCDGFMGNVLLKTVEGTAKFMAHEIKKVFTASAGTKIGYLLCKKGMDDFREMFNQDKVGGAPFLGIAKPVIKAHGSSNEIAVMNAVRRAIAYTKSGMIDAVKENIQYMTVE